MKKELFQPLSGNVMPRFGGPATFMRLPACTPADKLDVAFIGVPFDMARRIARGHASRRARSAMNRGC